jgi:predicted AlkP superfamily phosphohydrolase/phosphomutase
MFAAQLINGAKTRGQLTQHLLETQEWDFAIQVFSETHCAGHQLWHFHDTQHPAFDATSFQDSGDLLRDVYMAVDTAVGNILKGLDPGTSVILLTLHGMSHVCGGSLLLPGILERLGVMNAESDDTALKMPGISPQQLQQKHTSRNTLRKLYHHLPAHLRDHLYKIRSHISHEWLRRGTLLDIDPATSKAFYIGLGTGSTFSGIRLNLRGREPLGILSPGEAADQLCAQLTGDLLNISRPGTSIPLVRQVLRTRDLYEGPLLPELPDLLVEWEPDPPMGTTAAGDMSGAVWQAYSDAIGLVEKINTYCRTGEHRIEGMLIAGGAGITGGQLEREISILDLAPTFAKMLGCEMHACGRTLIPELLGQ